MSQRFKKRPVNRSLSNGVEVRQKGLKGYTVQGVRYLYHRASGTLLPNLPNDHPDFVAAYDAAERDHKIRSRGKGLRARIEALPWPSHVAIKFTPDVVAYSVAMAASFVLNAKPDNVLLYHVGDLGLDQAKDQSVKDRAQYIKVAAAFDLVSLRRARVAEGWTEYYATRTEETLVGCPSHVLRGDVTPDEYMALVALNERQASQSTSRAIRDELGINDQEAASIRNRFIDSGWLDNGRPPELTTLGLSLLT